MRTGNLPRIRNLSRNLKPVNDRESSRISVVSRIETLSRTQETDILAFRSVWFVRGLPSIGSCLGQFLVKD
jgi:hypothetical protein